MTEEDLLRDKLRKIEALFAGAATAGERAAAGAAADRLRERLKLSEQQEAAVEMRFSIADPWARQLFTALARRYGLRPYRYPRMHRQTVLLKGPPTFLQSVLWPEFQQLSAELSRFLAETTRRVITEEVYRDAGDAEEVPDPHQVGPL
ncbi:MAG: hypothetical protein AB7O43_08395 [Hyphomicrobiaceae bacterium]